MSTLLTRLDSLHWFWLMLVAPFLLFPNPQRTPAMLVIPGMWLLHWIVSRRSPVPSPPAVLNQSPVPRLPSPVPYTPLNATLLLLALMLLVSLWATYDIAFSLEKISGVVLGFGIFFAVVREGQRPLGWELYLLTFLGGGLAWAGVGLLGGNFSVRFSFLAPVINKIPTLLHELPGAESGLQHNAVGGTLLWVLPLFFALSVYAIKSVQETSLPSFEIPNPLQRRWGGRVNWLLRLFIWISTLLISGVLVLTQSRGSYLAISLTVMLMLFITLRSPWRWVLSVSVVIAGVGLGIFLYQAGGWEGFVAQLGLADESGMSINTLEGRLELWSRAIYGIQDFSFTGMGMNTFREVVHVLYPLFLIAPDVDIAHAHNEFLQAALDLGIPGLISFLSIYIIAFWMLWSTWKATRTPNHLTPNFLTRTSHFASPNLQRAIVLGLAGGLFAHMLFGLTDAITLGAKPGLFFWMLLGLIAGLHHQVTTPPVIALVPSLRGN